LLNRAVVATGDRSITVEPAGWASLEAAMCVWLLIA